MEDGLHIFIIMASIYIVLGITVGILINRRRQRPVPPRHKTQINRKPPLPPPIHDNNMINVNGRYELRLPAFKQGGMATIWLATERKTGRTCIIKTPRRGTVMDNVYLDKLVLEANFLKKLDYSGIVKYYDDFYYRGEYHLVIEYLHGETLLQVSPRTPYSEQQVIVWACELLDTLTYIHNRGMVHRDINPKNIMLCNDNTIRLIDFGTAKNIFDKTKEKRKPDPFTQITNRGFDIPELFVGGESDGRCDLCGLAQTCIYLLTLNQPNEICTGLFKASWPRSYSEATFVVNYLISNGVSSRTAKCLAQGILFSPDNRFADARAMKSALLSAEGFALKPEEVVVLR